MQDDQSLPHINLQMLGVLSFLHRIKAPIIFAILLFLWSVYYSPHPLIFFLILLLGMTIFQAITNYVSLASLLEDDVLPQPIPTQKFDRLLEDLKTEAVKIERLGFEEIDRYYIKRITYESVVFLFKHRQNNIYWEMTQVVRRIRYCSIFSEFDSGLYLTSLAIASGHFPRPTHSYLQALAQANYSTLLEVHQDALEIFEDHGHTAIAIPSENFQEHYLKVGKKFICHIMTIPLWYVKMTAWVLLKAGKKYQVPIREQLAKKIIKIPYNC
jgi:hypothetical protein